MEMDIHEPSASTVGDSLLPLLSTAVDETILLITCKIKLQVDVFMKSLHSVFLIPH